MNRTIGMIGSSVGLALTALPCGLYFANGLSHQQTLWTMLVGTVLWFAITPTWMGRTTQ